MKKQNSEYLDEDKLRKKFDKRYERKRPKQSEKKRYLFELIKSLSMMIMHIEMDISHSDVKIY